MKKKFLARMESGVAVEADAKRFSFKVAGKIFWFALHNRMDAPWSTQLTISHWSSGLKVTVINAVERQAAVGIADIALAKHVLQRFVDRIGEERVASKLREADANSAFVDIARSAA